MVAYIRPRLANVGIGEAEVSPVCEIKKAKLAASGWCPNLLSRMAVSLCQSRYGYYIVPNDCHP